MSASKFPQVKYLPPDKEYHWNIIYDEDGDTLDLSHKFVDFLVKKLEDCYGTKCFYCHRDARPGKSVFSEFFRGVDSSIWTLVIVTNEFSKNGWANYCKEADFYNKIVKNNADKLIPVIIGDAVTPMELKTNTALHFHSDSIYWNDEKLFKKLEKLLVNEPVLQISSADVLAVPVSQMTSADVSDVPVSQMTSADVLDVPVSQMTSAEVTHNTTCSIGRFQPGTDSNNHSLNHQLETDNPENQNIVRSERQITTGSPSPSSSSVSFVSLSNDPDLTCDQPSSSYEVQTNDADYDLTKLDQAVENINPNTLKLSGKSLSIDSLVNSLSNDPIESTKQILSPSGSGYTSEREMTPPDHDISPPSQENLQREVNSYKSDTRVDNSESAQINLCNPEWKDTRSKDARENQTKTLEDTSGQRWRLTGVDQTQPKNSINIKTQERVDLVRGERTGPDGCESVFSDEAASDSADLMSMSQFYKWTRTIIVGGSHIIKPIMNGLTRTDSFI